MPLFNLGGGDPLLRLVRHALTALLGLALIGVAGAIVAIPVILAGREGFAARLAGQGIGGGAVEWIAVMLALAAAMLALAFFFLRHLRRIVESVSDGDPFVPMNAQRLRHMAWLALAIQIVAVPITPLLIWFDAAPYKPNVHHGSDGISIGALVLVLILFVLARVFAVGAEMREELEGTV